MKLLPTRKKWDSWYLPSKIGVAAAYVTFISVFASLIIYLLSFTEKNNKPQEIPINSNSIVIKDNNINQLNINQYIGKSAEYNELIQQRQRLTKLLRYIPESEQLEKASVASELKIVENQIIMFKENVLSLARIFDKIEINTERLMMANEYFEKGEFKKANTLLNVVEITREQTELLLKRNTVKEELEQIESQLYNNSLEFLIKAILTRLDIDYILKIDQIKDYYEKALTSQRLPETLYSYASFLLENKEYNKSIKLLEEVVSLIDQSEYSDCGQYEEILLMSLMRLGDAYTDMEKYEVAESTYLKALSLSKSSVKKNISFFEPKIADISNSLGILYKTIENYPEAEKAYQRALKIYLEIGEVNPDKYIPKVASILNNLGTLHGFQNNYDLTQKIFFVTALNMYMLCSYEIQETIQPDISMTLNNLGSMFFFNQIYDSSRVYFEKALSIREKLAAYNPSKYDLDLCQTLLGLGILYNNSGNTEQGNNHIMRVREITNKYPNIPKAQQMQLLTHIYSQ